MKKQVNMSEGLIEILDYLRGDIRKDYVSRDNFIDNAIKQALARKYNKKIPVYLEDRLEPKYKKALENRRQRELDRIKKKKIYNQRYYKKNTKYAVPTSPVKKTVSG